MGKDLPQSNKINKKIYEKSVLFNITNMLHLSFEST